MKLVHKAAWVALLAAVVLGASGCDRRDGNAAKQMSNSASSPGMSRGDAASMPGGGASR